MIHGKLASLAAGLHHPKMKWFVGPGGPVPLTPGYVPYIVSTRSPRDFFAFPPDEPQCSLIPDHADVLDVLILKPGRRPG